MSFTCSRGGVGAAGGGILFADDQEGVVVRVGGLRNVVVDFMIAAPRRTWFKWCDRAGVACIVTIGA